jgi:hypothetical protein
MAKKKAKKSKKTTKKAAASTITVVLPADMSTADRAVLEGVAELFKAVNFDVSQITFVNANDLSQDTLTEMQVALQPMVASC